LSPSISTIDQVFIILELIFIILLHFIIFKEKL
jgi:hypothetical protein